MAQQDGALKGVRVIDLGQFMAGPMAASTHKTQQSYEGYAKRTAKRMLSATRKRHAHRLAAANETGASVQNEAPDAVQTGKTAKAANA